MTLLTGVVFIEALVDSQAFVLDRLPEVRQTAVSLLASYRSWQGSVARHDVPQMQATLLWGVVQGAAVVCDVCSRFMDEAGL